MSDKNCLTALASSGCFLASIFLVIPAVCGAETISTNDTQAITGSGASAITGSGISAITGSGISAITGSGISAITGSGSRAITGGGANAITGSGISAITGSGANAITGSGVNLLLLGRVSFVGNDFVSVLGQTVFIENASSAFAAGSMVAVYGAIDFDTGGIVGASILDAASAGFGASGLSFLTGFVDAVDYSKGIALVSGMAVDYNALLSVGSAPSVGDMVSVTGRNYGDLGVLVADPNLRLEIR